MLGIEKNGDEAFLTRLYNMVNDPATDSIASWTESGKSFIVPNPIEFAKYVMHNKLMSRIMPSILTGVGYNFKSVGLVMDTEFANDNFVRGQPQLMKNIPRPGFFVTREDLLEVNNILTKEKEEMLDELKRQELLIKELKCHLQQERICKL
ncbi:unnamed protein product [Cochlearia groenlandica]